MSEVEQIEEDFEVDSLTADLAAAWEDADLGEDDGEDSEAGLHQPADVAATAQEPDQEAGTGDSDGPGGSVDDAGVQGKVQRDNTNEKDSESLPPPVGLSATAREVWKDTPKEMQAEIAKREKDFAMGIQQYAEGAKRAAGMDATLAPYQQYTAMNGGPGQTIKNLLQTGATLQMGSPIQKAQTVAQLIQQFGVDIGQLDQLLVGQTPKENPQDAVQQQIQAAIAPYQQQMQQFQAMQKQAVQQEQSQISQEVNDFGSTHEFYNDVRTTMADALDLAANRGQNMTMEQAYTLACQMHPEINKIITARNNAPKPNQRRAASSIYGSPAGDGTAAPDSLRSAIEMAWDGAGRT